ncbi:MAG: hypothetical protein JJU46_14455 [Balneolaceae bacterium]|nr:hypothetical protein [Balneolaceae bacterium]MCH8550206.1 hypothetical protein [Balneolaceae bacterium]
MKEEIKKRIQIAEAAADRYVHNQRFTIRSLADELEISSDEIFELFPNRRSILRYFYESRLILWKEQTQSIKGYETFSLGEKLSNLFLTLLDLLNDRREFVLMSYKEFVLCSGRRDRFKQNLKEELRTIFASDKEIPTTASPFVRTGLTYDLITLQFHLLVRFWSEDDSHLNENSMALVDKWSTFTEEVFYSKVAEKGLDLAKFLYYQSPLNKCSIMNEKRGLTNE